MLGVGSGGPVGPDDAAGDVGRARRPAAAARVGRYGEHPSAGQDSPGAGERDAWVVLDSVLGVGPVSFGRLVLALGSATEALRLATAPNGAARLVEATRDGDGSPSLTHAAARAVADAAERAPSVLSAVARAGVTVVTLADAEYPARLRRIDLPPPVLFVRGSTAALDSPNAVAIVGTRRPTDVGRQTAARIADAVAGLGATVVSGLALGIDAAAHRATVRAGRPTIAVIGGGHERLYPAGHRTLAAEIARGDGAVVSEFGPDTIPTRGTFPRRNRIISGLADATVVVEAGARSGALTTAAWALEQSRGLFIVPGRLDDPAVAGSLAFLREAGPEARVVAGIPELLEDLGLFAPVADSGASDPAAGGARLLPETTVRAVLATLPAVERSIAGAILEGRTSVDELVSTTALTGATVLGALTALEMRGLVIEGFGRYRPAGALAAGRRSRAGGAAAREARGVRGGRAA
jgi:DNA processing protein